MMKTEESLTRRLFQEFTIQVDKVNKQQENRIIMTLVIWESHLHTSSWMSFHMKLFLSWHASLSVWNPPPTSSLKGALNSLFDINLNECALIQQQQKIRWVMSEVQQNRL